MYEPWDALKAPRFTGPRTYARLPYVQDLEGVHAAVFGIPWDGGASFRGGARFGPEGVRSASGMIRTYNPVQKVQVFGALSTIDYGDAPTAPGYIEQTLERVEAFVRPIAESEALPVAIGGDHSMTLAELRALAAVHGPLGLVHLDSHMDLWDTYFDGLRYSHGTLFRRALEEGILGLYVGTPLTERDSTYTFLPPDQVFVYRGPLLRMCHDVEELTEEIEITVVHEVAHHFGIDDDQLHAWGWG